MQNIRPTTEVVIGKNEFTIEHWSPTKAMVNLPKIGKFFAIPLATVFGSFASGGSNFSEALPTAMLYLFEKMEEEDINKLFALILSDVHTNGMHGVNIDEVFAEDISELFELIAAVLKANYGCFFKKQGFANLQNLLIQWGLVEKANEQTTTEQ